jgi:hypothetical protein
MSANRWKNKLIEFDYYYTLGKNFQYDLHKEKLYVNKKSIAFMIRKNDHDLSMIQMHSGTCFYVEGLWLDEIFSL